MSFPFAKMVASGNDFIIIDNRSNFYRLEWTSLLCDRKHGIGADGVLLLENSRIAHLKMRIINSDGTEVQMCGNGARCIAKYSNLIDIAGVEVRIETLAGLIYAFVNKDNVKVQLTNPKDIQINQKLNVDDKQIEYHFINTGVPHVVIIEDDLEKIDVAVLGRKIRYHSNFQPSGTNVNFIKIIDSKTIKIRTYERGVEEETLSCGTGSAAGACISYLLNLTKPPITVLTKGQEELIIYFENNLGRITSLFLEGKVKFVFEGKFTEKLLKIKNL
jgi:diaminopimelate epimerase